MVEELTAQGFSVFLDLKFHDIPNTVAGAVRSATSMGASLLTIHAAGGPAMLRAAAEAAAATKNAPQLLAVTVLTSMDKQQLAAIGIETTAADQVLRLARMAIASEIQRTRLLTGRSCASAPGTGHGTRGWLFLEFVPPGAAVGDQKRIATPADAIRAGASQLVIGRPITQASRSGESGTIHPGRNRQRHLKSETSAIPSTRRPETHRATAVRWAASICAFIARFSCRGHADEKAH